jgi:transcriptional regulator with XRE-family HTH domain
VIGKQLRQRREAKEMTQRELSIRAGLTINAISELERGVATNPEYQTLQALANALGCTVAELVTPPSTEPATKAAAS